jgi:predicted RNA binding protein YcfA (HicA-like mRNA interferase family)
MSKPTSITALQASKALLRLGFHVARHSDSHKLYVNQQGRRVTIPYHSGSVLHPMILKGILVDAETSMEEFLELLERQ